MYGIYMNIPCVTSKRVGTPIAAQSSSGTLQVQARLLILGGTKALTVATAAAISMDCLGWPALPQLPCL